MITYKLYLSCALYLGLHDQSAVVFSR